MVNHENPLTGERALTLADDLSAAVGLALAERWLAVRVDRHARVGDGVCQFTLRPVYATGSGRPVDVVRVRVDRVPVDGDWPWALTSTDWTGDRSAADAVEHAVDVVVDRWRCALAGI